MHSAWQYAHCTRMVLVMTPNTLQDVNIEGSARQMNVILRRKLTSLREIKNLSEQAFGYINEEDIELLNNTIEAKQKLIHEVDHLDKLFLMEFDKLKSDLGLASIEDLHMSQSPELGELRGNTAEILGLLQKIFSFDEKINREVAKLREGITAELTRIRKQKHISTLYSNDGTRRQHNESPDYSAKPAFDTKK